MKTKLIRAVLRWIFHHYRDEFSMVLVEERMHLHRNPKKKEADAVRTEATA